jgi:hypothetical protein
MFPYKIQIHSIFYPHIPEVSLRLHLHSHSNDIVLVQSACSRAVLVYHIHALEILLRPYNGSEGKATVESINYLTLLPTELQTSTNHISPVSCSMHAFPIAQNNVCIYWITEYSLRTKKMKSF